MLVKIVDRETFLDLPEGTVFSNYDDRVYGVPFELGDLCIKQANVECCVDHKQYVNATRLGYIAATRLKHEDLLEHMQSGQSFDVDLNSVTGFGGYLKTANMFVVWEEKELRQLIDVLSRCLNT